MPQRVELPLYSMFVRTPIYEVGPPDNRNVVFGLLQPAVVPDATDTVYKVPIGAVGRLDLIATSVYGVPDLWWVIAHVNDILDPFTGPAAGTEIRIPTRTRLGTLGILSV